MPSLIHWCAKTMATSDDFARDAAEAGSDPESNFTLADGAIAFTAFNGEVGNQTCDSHAGAVLPGGSTCAEPPPEIIPMSAFFPMIAMLRSLPASRGSRVFSLRNSTM